MFAFICILYMNISTFCVCVWTEYSPDSVLAIFMFFYMFLMCLALGRRKLGPSGFYRPLGSKIENLRGNTFPTMWRLQLLPAWEQCQEILVKQMNDVEVEGATYPPTSLSCLRKGEPQLVAGCPDIPVLLDLTESSVEAADKLAVSACISWNSKILLPNLWCFLSFLNYGIYYCFTSPGIC